MEVLSVSPSVVWWALQQSNVHLVQRIDKFCAITKLLRTKLTTIYNVCDSKFIPTHMGSDTPAVSSQCRGVCGLRDLLHPVTYRSRLVLRTMMSDCMAIGSFDFGSCVLANQLT